MKFHWQKDPFQIFDQLFQQAVDLKVHDANAMCLATVNEAGQPTVRVVLYKNRTDNGLVFFTNYNSRKGQEIEKNPKVSANFFWPQMEKQVRFDGIVRKISRQENEKYFHSRPRLSQLGAWASEQSREIPNIDFLQKKLDKFQVEFENKEIPCPDDWGGYELIPHEIEFWFGRQGRLHERYIYSKTNVGWTHLMRSP